RRGPEGPSRPTPAPMNVPIRPKIVGPAGPTLKVQTPVKLTGPKVVRIEAPEVIDRPKPRRFGPVDVGLGRDMPMIGIDDEGRGRSPRRSVGGGANKRRAG